MLSIEQGPEYSGDHPGQKDIPVAQMLIGKQNDTERDCSSGFAGQEEIAMTVSWSVL